MCINAPGHAEVQDPDIASTVDGYVCWLEISVDDMRAVQILEPAEQLVRDVNSVDLCEALKLGRPQRVLQVIRHHWRCCQVDFSHIRVDCPRVDDRDDIRGLSVSREHTQQPQLPERLPCVFNECHASNQLLNGDLDISSNVLGTGHVSECPLPYKPVYRVGSRDIPQVVADACDVQRAC